MHKVTFYPLGNADCCLIELNNGQKLLFDYADTRNKEDDKDTRIDLPVKLREVVNNEFNVVAFTHVDDDHIHGSTDFFYLEHAKKYQSEDRIKIKELWVPAAMITEVGLQGEAGILRAEARYRLKKGAGIRVFSRPERLKEWLEKEELTIEERRHLITDAGQLVPEFEKYQDGVEFFVHSPFAVHADDTLIDRNACSLILQATFYYDRQETKFMLIGDSTHEILTDIVNITKFHKREGRLEWDIYNIPHHCSYLALNSEKGEEKTIPVPEVEWLLNQGREKGVLVSCSNPIPKDGEDTQPPHKQAGRYYKEVAAEINGEFKVTMEHPTISKPEPLVITIDGWGATVKKTIMNAGVVAVSRPAPRAGAAYAR
ncbi:MAG: hypothetical protein ACMUIP_06990 [bacterium]